MEYDYSKLNDREFEALGASIIEKKLNKTVETFKAGRDEGVDGRFWIGNQKEGIIQCKHYIETPYTTLVSKLKKEELKKVQKLNPSKYIFITSKSLSRINKQEIKTIFHPFIKQENDILGKEDLNDFLSKKDNQDIVERNYKLWISSTSVLDLIYNNAIKGRSESTIREIKENSFKYAFTENHNKGLEILEKRNVVILTGEPGIGKTTLADNLALFYIAKGYEFCDIEESISEAESIFREKEKKKILFYCDDFLGSNLYDAINNKKDSHIVQFINRICKDNSKKFILTSRTNILNKAYRLSHKFQNAKIRDNEFLLEVNNLTEIDKAQILYNHIYHSTLNKEYLDKIYLDKRYLQIIKHRNFNPRIIEFVTDNDRVKNIYPENYWDYIKKSLDEPEDIWADYFQNQMDDCIRALTYLTVFNKGKISEDKLRLSYNNFLEIHTVNLGDNSDKSFEGVRKLAIKSLLNRNQISENTYEYTLFNPSITDFILSSYSDEDELISNILISLDSETSIKYFDTISTTKNIKNVDTIQEKLFDYFFEKKMKEENWDFIILLSYIDFFNEKLTDRIEKFIKTLINSDSPCGNELSKLLIILTEFEKKINCENYHFLNCFVDKNQDEDTLKELLDFIERNKIEESHILEQAEYHLENYLEEIIYYEDLDINYSLYVEESYLPDGSSDYDVDYKGIQHEVESILDSYLEGFNKSTLEKIEINISGIITNIDIEDKAILYMESFNIKNDDEFDGLPHHSNESLNDIEAIFERS